MRGIQNTARQSIPWCKSPEGDTESCLCTIWFMVSYLIKVIRPRLPHLQLLLRKQETIWEGDRGCPRMDEFNLHTQSLGVLKLLKQTALLKLPTQLGKGTS